MNPIEGGQCMREKYWSEKTDQEKIFLLGEVAEMLAKRIIQLEAHIADILQHSHSDNGELSVPLLREQLEIPYWLKNPLRREGK